MLGALVLQCRKCTRESRIPAPTKEVAVELAKLRGWVMERGGYVCPTCPAVRPYVADTCGCSQAEMASCSKCGGLGKIIKHDMDIHYPKDEVAA